MAESKPPPESVPPELRRRAEERQRQRAQQRPHLGDHERVVQELEIHQFELEMQNQELSKARQEAEAALNRYTDLFDSAPIGYAVLNAAGAIQALNRAAAQMLVSPQQKFANKYFRSFVYSDDRIKFDELLQGFLHIGQETKEVRELKLNGAAGVIDVAITASFRLYAEALVLLALEDITARKHAEAALTDAGRRRDEFLAVLSHELRNPLMPIRTSVELARRTDFSREVVLKAFAVIERQSVHLQRIVDDLLEVSRVAFGKIVLQRELLDLGQEIEETVNDHRNDYAIRGLTLNWQRVTAEPLWIKADPTRLTQIMHNLLDNSAKFTPRGGTVEVSLRRLGDDRAELAVRDNGIGMSAYAAEHAFETFAQAPQTSDRPLGGLGLGLSTVKGLVDLHSGTVSLASPGPGRGTTVTMRLLLSEAPAALERSLNYEPFRPRHVLIIEDTEDTAEALGALLEELGHQVRVAHDGPGGIAEAEKFHPEIILCDIGLPGMDGYEVAKSIRRQAGLKDIFLVALSGYARASDVQRAIDAGFNRHLAKPAGLTELEQLLASVPIAERNRSDNDGA